MYVSYLLPLAVDSTITLHIPATSRLHPIHSPSEATTQERLRVGPRVNVSIDSLACCFVADTPGYRESTANAVSARSCLNVFFGTLLAVKAAGVIVRRLAGAKVSAGGAVIPFGLLHPLARERIHTGLFLSGGFRRGSCRPRQFAA